MSEQSQALSASSAAVSLDKEEWEHMTPPLPPFQFFSYNDWAMIRPNPVGSLQRRPPRQNMFFPNGHGQEPVILNSVAEKPRCHLAGVYMVSGIRGVLRARLLGSPSMLGTGVTGRGQDLCTVWTAILDDGSGK